MKILNLYSGIGGNRKLWGNEHEVTAVEWDESHLFWSNFEVEPKEFDRPKIRSAQIPQLQEFLGYDLSDYKLPNKRQVLRNCVNPEVGKYILESAMVII